MLNIGFIGLGIMGAPMAANLQAGGNKLFVYDIKQPPAALLEGGATACASAAEVAKRADIIIVMVPDTPHVDAALFGENGVAGGLLQIRRRWKVGKSLRQVDGLLNYRQPRHLPDDGFGEMGGSPAAEAFAASGLVFDRCDRSVGHVVELIAISGRSGNFSCSGGVQPIR